MTIKESFHPLDVYVINQLADYSGIYMGDRTEFQSSPEKRWTDLSVGVKRNQEKTREKWKKE